MTRTFFPLIALGMCLSGAAMAAPSTETQAVAVIHAEWKPVIRGIVQLSELTSCGIIPPKMAHHVADLLGAGFTMFEVQHGSPPGIPQAPEMVKDGWALGEAFALAPLFCAHAFGTDEDQAVFAQGTAAIEALTPTEVLEVFGG